jgi:hydroxypyruvate isomerase
MPRFAANLSMMFNEWEFLDRFAAAADAGFDAVEFLFPYEHSAEAIGRRLRENGLTQALFNLQPGDWAGGERGIASISGREKEFREGVERAKEYVEATGVKRVHMMSGHNDPADPVANATYRANLRHAAEALGPMGVQILLEPINGRDMPGYFMNDFNRAEAIIREIASPHVALQFDMYHRQILHGDVTMGFRAQFPLIAHVQIASVPSRNEPSGEELNYSFLYEEMDRLGYAGFVGCEYRPRAGTVEGLSWFAPWRRR